MMVHSRADRAEEPVAASLSDDDRAALLAAARAALRHHLGLGPLPQLPEQGRLGARRGAFVALLVDGALRGSAGSLQAAGPLSRAVAEMAVAAASRDPRFPPLSAEEADRATLRISILEPPAPLRHPADLKIGVHGLSVTRGWHRGVLLPGAALAGGWDAETFLERACLSAGLPPRSWQAASEEGPALVEVFVAEEFTSA
jgi:AmmeMemoRadiSam system protein A